MLSIVINADTRPERLSQEGMFSGVVDRDFLDEGILNKKKFFEGFDIETILFLDLHEDIDEKTLEYLRQEVNTLVIRKHNKKFEDQVNFAGFNDLNYIHALSLARGEYVFHFDMDCAVFKSSDEIVYELIKMLDTYDYISYPSNWSPLPVVDESFDHVWVSTRFFMCKRSTLDFGEILKCQLDYDYWCKTYPVNRKCHWLEHLLGSISKYKGKGVFYPPFEENKWILFCWENYEKWTLRRLNTLPYEDIKTFVYSHGGIHYPNNLTI